MGEKVRVGFLKLGCIGTALPVELLLDERADREDIDVRVVTSGAKMGEGQAKEIAKRILDFDPDLVVVVSPNATLPGPTMAREIVAKAGVPTIVISDRPSSKIADELTEKGFGYIIVNADSMIGARREFLDPIEMALYNADIIKVLSVTGSLKAVLEEIDRVIGAIKEGKKPELPSVIVDKDRAIAAGDFQNPYARVKAMAAHEIAERVAAVTTRGCFVVKERERYVPLVASAHEMMRTAASLADEAREIEKGLDAVIRTPHSRQGLILRKRKFIEKPT